MRKIVKINLGLWKNMSGFVIFLPFKTFFSFPIFDRPSITCSWGWNLKNTQMVKWTFVDRYEFVVWVSSGCSDSPSAPSWTSTEAFCEFVKLAMWLLLPLVWFIAMRTALSDSLWRWCRLAPRERNCCDDGEAVLLTRGELTFVCATLSSSSREYKSCEQANN